MATYTWEFGAAGSELYFTVVYDTATNEFTVNSLEGSFDLNALWFSNGDDIVDGDTKLAKSDNSLNMNGSNTVWDDDGNATSEKIAWDSYAKLSNPGLGAEGEDKASFIGDGESKSFSLADLGLTEFDPEGITLGVRATSVNGGDSIKFVDKEAEVGGDDNPFVITFNEDGNPIANGVMVPDNLDGANGNDGTNGANVNQGGTGGDGADGGVAPAAEDGGTIDGDGAVLGGGDGGYGGDGGSGGNGNQSGTGGDGGAGGDGGDGSDTIAISDPNNWTSILIDATEFGGAIIGGSGGDGGDGGNGGNAQTSGTGGDGGNGGDGGDGAYAIVNGSISDVFIIGGNDLIILGGSAGDGGDGGSGGGANSGTSGTGGQDGTDGIPSAAFSDPVDVDASAFTGHLTISGSDGNDTMVMGNGGSLIYDTLGVDTYTLGTGVDVVHFSLADLADVDTIINFDATGGGDVLDISDLLDGYEEGVSDIADFVRLSESGGSTIVQVDTNGGGDNFQDVVTLEGLVGLDLNTLLLINGNIDIDPNP